MRETLAPALRAAVLTAFVAGTLLFLLNPPSLSGAGGLMTTIVGGLALVLLTGWGAVALGGPRPMSEDDFERVVERTERLAEQSAPVRDESYFEALVAEAIDRLPEEFRELVRDTPVVVSRRGSEFRAYGHYFGGSVARSHYEHRIVVYQDTLERDFGHDPELLAAQVERTLRHEMAHHLGWNEPGVRGLGL